MRGTRWAGALATAAAALSALVTPAAAGAGVTQTGTSARTTRVTTSTSTAPSAGCARPSTAANGQTGPSDQLRTLTTPAASGSYLLSLPRHHAPRTPAPLVLLFYGFGSNPAQFASLTNLPAQGAQAGDVVAVPEIQPNEAEWQFSGSGTDAAFVNALIGSLEQTYCIDTHAVFATGFSAGAAFTIFYACAHQSQITAIGTVAVDFQLGCTKPMPILAFHGTKDPEVPYQNGAIGLSLPGVKVRGTQLNLADWARLDRCRRRPTRHSVGTQVTLQRWAGCAETTSVALYTVLGGGHTWSGADPQKGLGLTTQQVSATTQILRFFNRLAAA